MQSIYREGKEYVLFLMIKRAPYWLASWRARELRCGHVVVLGKFEQAFWKRLKALGLLLP